jgi:superfamily II DNA or RNA helicase
MYSLKHEPRVWQVAAFEIWRNALRGVISVVTGGGKTIFAAQCINYFLTEFPNGRAYIVVPTLVLLDQWIVDLKDELGAADSDIAVYSGEEKTREPRTFNILVINTAREWLQKLAAETPGLLVVDECHRAGSEKNALALRGEFRATLGLSATPVREYDDGFEHFVVPALGNVIYEYDYTDAKNDDVVAPFELVNVGFNLLPHEATEYDALTARLRGLLRRRDQGGEVDEPLRALLQRRAAVSAASLLRIPLAVKLAVNEKGKRCLIFHERVDAANKIVKALHAANIRVTSYHTGIPPDIRRDNLWLFRKGMFDTLVCCRALDEGMNVPETSVAIVASSTASHRQRIQRLGRVLRPAPGKEMATIYTLFGTDAEKTRLQKEADRLSDVATISWVQAAVTIDAATPDRRGMVRPHQH